MPVNIVEYRPNQVRPSHSSDWGLREHQVTSRPCGAHTRRAVKPKRDNLLSVRCYACHRFALRAAILQAAVYFPESVTVFPYKATFWLIHASAQFFSAWRFMHSNEVQSRVVMQPVSVDDGGVAPASSPSADSETEQSSSTASNNSNLFGFSSFICGCVSATQ